MTGLKTMLLERRVEALSGALEARDARLGEALAASRGVDAAAMQQVGGRLEGVLRAKNAEIEALRLEAARASKARADCVRVCEAKLAERGVPPSEAGLAALAGFGVAGNGGKAGGGGVGAKASGGGASKGGGGGVGGAGGGRAGGSGSAGGATTATAATASTATTGR